MVKVTGVELASTNLVRTRYFWFYRVGRFPLDSIVRPTRILCRRGRSDFLHEEVPPVTGARGSIYKRNRYKKIICSE